MKKFLIFACLLCAAAIFAEAQIPSAIGLQILRAEDERRYDRVLENLLTNKSEKVRVRAALAAGRIGDEKAIAALSKLLAADTENVCATVLFAVGEIESGAGLEIVLGALRDEKNSAAVRMRAVEAAGKIAAAIAATDKTKNAEAGKAILDAVEAEAKQTNPDRSFKLLGLTAILRARPTDSAITAAKFLNDSDARIRADAANTLARLRARNAGEKLRVIVMKDADPIVRANAARALAAAAEDKDSLKVLLEAALNDKDSRVRVSAIRAVGGSKGKDAAAKLLARGNGLINSFTKSKFKNPSEKSELLEIAAAVGRLLAGTNNEAAIKFLQSFRVADRFNSPETEIALAQIAPELYIQVFAAGNSGLNDWRAASSYAQGLAELAKSENADIKGKASTAATIYFGEFVVGVPPAAQAEMGKALPDLVRAVAAFKAANVSALLREILTMPDVFTRAAAAELLSEQPAAKENTEALEKAFRYAFDNDRNYNDAQLAILDALFKTDKQSAVKTLVAALNSKDYLVRKKAFELLKTGDLKKDAADENAAGEFQAAGKINVLPYTGGAIKLGQVLNSNADYLRALSRKNGSVNAVLTTEKGTFSIALTPEDAPLTVDNFIKLARANYFNNLEVHRVVPNFVMQDGDPRGDGNGGPAWSIRCEINMLEYERGAVGMALSGKDTGGSQWFVTHSPQPHLDGGYTVFGKVNEADMKVVDQIVRGDKILSVKIIERNVTKKK